jgi:DNA-binding response OmpR family regulator
METPSKLDEIDRRILVALQHNGRMTYDELALAISENATIHRILIVDDSRDNADGLAALLKTRGYEVQTAYDGEEAIITDDEFAPHVVLLDIGMPKLNGYETCRRIRSRLGGQEKILIALTGWGKEDDRRRTEEAGFDYHMVKPLDPSVLMSLLSSLPPLGRLS